MNIEALVTIIGGLIVLALSINAFFLKSIYSEVNYVKIQIASLIAGIEHIHAEITRVEKYSVEEIKALRTKHHTMANALQALLLEVERLKK